MAAGLRKGQKFILDNGNGNLNVLLVGLGWQAGKDVEIDTAAFLLGDNHKVAKEEDFVFYGNERHISRSVIHLGKQMPGGQNPDAEQIKIDLSAVPPYVRYIDITATIYEADVRRQNFGQVTGTYIRLLDEKKGTEIMRFDIKDQFSVETAIVVGEIYRYKGAWKFNAVGAGYKGGLAALCGSFGIEVADSAAPSVVSSPKAEQKQNEIATAPAPQRMKTMATTDTKDEILRPTGKSVNLQTGQKICLEKQNGAGLKHIMVGLGWDAAKPSGGLTEVIEGNIDCDASAFLCTGGYIADSSDIIYFGRLRHKSGAVVHMGGSLTGEGAGDDEQICVDLGKLPPKYDKIVFAVNIFHFFKTKQHFGMIKDAFMRLVDEDTSREICRFSLTDNYDGMKAVIFGEVYRQNGRWLFTPCGKGTKDDSVQELASRYMHSR